MEYISKQALLDKLNCVSANFLEKEIMDKKLKLRETKCLSLEKVSYLLSLFEEFIQEMPTINILDKSEDFVMLIRSQDDEHIVFTKDIDSIYINDNGYLPHRSFLSDEPPKPYVDPTLWFVQTANYHLGTYSSKEKAIAVLDLIQEAYYKQQKEFQERIISVIKKYELNIDDIENNYSVLKFLSPDCCLFTMPKEDEINVETIVSKKIIYKGENNVG